MGSCDHHLSSRSIVTYPDPSVANFTGPKNPTVPLRTPQAREAGPRSAWARFAARLSALADALDGSAPESRCLPDAAGVRRRLRGDTRSY